MIAGQGTIALEMLAAAPQLETLVVPVGGGGMIAGIAVAAKALKPGIEIVGVETSGFPAVHCALHGRAATFAGSTIAEGIAVKEPGALTLPIIRAHVADVLLVEDGDIEQAIVQLLEIEKTVVEGAGAAGPRRAARAIPTASAAARSASCSPAATSTRSSCPTSSSAAWCAPDGSCGCASRCATCPARWRRSPPASPTRTPTSRKCTTSARSRDLPVLSAEVEFVLQTRGPEHVQEIVAALGDAGFKAEVVHD